VPDEIVVPASVSNLGPGFDALAVAVRLYLRVRVVRSMPGADGALEMVFLDAPPRGDDRIAAAFRMARASIGTPAPGLRVEVRSDIPQRAGLGSSAAAAVAGLRLYEAVTAPRPVGEWLQMASRLEGHPDNAAAALTGGLVASCQVEGGAVLTQSWPWPAGLRLVVATPHRELETGFARSVLPSAVPLADAVFNLQRALLLVRSLETGRFDRLREALRDRWHQPARAALVPGLAEALAIDDPAVLGVFLAGSGPSIVALAAGGEPEVASRLQGIYDEKGVSCTIRVLDAHPPEAVK
jgi:homoserine kinase